MGIETIDENVGAKETLERKVGAVGAAAVEKAAAKAEHEAEKEAAEAENFRQKAKNESAKDEP